MPLSKGLDTISGNRIAYIVPGLKALDTIYLEHRITNIVPGLKG